jgi:hypothetical protein
MRWPLAVLLAACGRLGFDAVASQPVDAPSQPDVRVPDARPPDAAVAVCGATMLLKDDFSVPTRSAQWQLGQSASGVTVTQGGGELQIAFAANVGNGTFGQYVQTAAQSFVGGCVTARIDAIPNSSTVFSYVVVQNGTSGLGFEVQAGQLDAVFYPTLTTATSIRSAAFVPSMHRYIRLRESSGTYFFDVSGDGTTFSTFTSSSTTGIAATSLAIEIGAEASAAATNAGTPMFGPILELGP